MDFPHNTKNVFWTTACLNDASTAPLGHSSLKRALECAFQSIDCSKRVFEVLQGREITVRQIWKAWAELAPDLLELE